MKTSSPVLGLAAAAAVAGAVLLLVHDGRADDAATARRAPAPAPAPAIAPAPGPRPAIPIDAGRELLIADLSVVEDPLRTTWGRAPAPATLPVRRDRAAWTFGRLIQDLAGTNDPSDLVLRWLEHWEREQAVNGFVAPARPLIRPLVIDPWLRRSGGRRLDLTKAPFRLLAIVNRLDLRRNPVYGPGNAGEGRFVFGVLDENGNALPFTVIFEYELPARTLDDVKKWAEAWHALGSIPFGPAYGDALNRVTDGFARRGAAPGKPNGSALNQIRTNEIALAGPWELREFVISPRSGLLVQTTVKQTPDISFNQTADLAKFVNANEAEILAGRHAVPPAWLGAASPVSLVFDAPGIRNPEARHGLALATCSGCHQAETGTGFLHVAPRAPGTQALLSGFLTGTVVPDPVSGRPHAFDDLARRAEDLRRVLRSSRMTLATEAPSTRVH